jgi:hypothetical protein
MLAPDDFAQEGYFYSIGVPPVRIDILMSLPGMAFEQAWPNRVAAAFDGTTVWFVAPDDLIAIKQASGRRQDIRDAKAIRRARANRPPPR